MLDPAIRRQHDDLGNAPDLMPAGERVFGESQDWFRAAGACRCSVCGREYYDHPSVLGALWLTRICDDTFVKL
jgi:hypothetical protein